MMKNSKMDKFDLTQIAKAMIMVTALVHLIFSNVHVKAMLLLENEVCGFAMFLFVLFGLTALFEATRVKEGSKEKLIMVFLALLSSVCGAYLIATYRYAINHQHSIDVAVISKSLTFSMIVIGAYVVASVLTALSVLNRPRQ